MDHGALAPARRGHSRRGSHRRGVYGPDEEGAMTPGELSQELRQGSGAFLGQRRAVVGLSLTTMAALGIIVLYQMGIIVHVPEPNLPGFDGDKVNGSDQAYELLA